jgi:hypothetical protein
MIVSQVWCQDDSSNWMYLDKIEVDPTSSAINDFTSLQTLQNEDEGYTLVVLKSEKYSEGKK